MVDGLGRQRGHRSCCEVWVEGGEQWADIAQGHVDRVVGVGLDSDIAGVGEECRHNARAVGHLLHLVAIVQ